MDERLLDMNLLVIGSGFDVNDIDGCVVGGNRIDCRLNGLEVPASIGGDDHVRRDSVDGATCRQGDSAHSDEHHLLQPGHVITRLNIADVPLSASLPKEGF